MYRAQRLAEFALYDSDPKLVDSELDQYLNITADDIKRAVVSLHGRRKPRRARYRSHACR